MLIYGNTALLDLLSLTGVAIISIQLPFGTRGLVEQESDFLNL